MSNNNNIIQIGPFFPFHMLIIFFYIQFKYRERKDKIEKKKKVILVYFFFKFMQKFKIWPVLSQVLNGEILGEAFFLTLYIYQAIYMVQSRC